MRANYSLGQSLKMTTQAKPNGLFFVGLTPFCKLFVIFGVIASFWILSTKPKAQESAPDWVVQVVSYNSSGLLNQVSGFLAGAPKVVITSAHIMEGAERVEVILQSGEAVEAQLIHADRETALAVLRVRGNIPSSGFLSLEETNRGSAVSTPGFWSDNEPGRAGGGFPASPAYQVSVISRSTTAKGVVTDIDGISLQHVTVLGRGAYGAPLLNPCGEIVGVTVPSPSMSLEQIWAEHSPGPRQNAVSRAGLTGLFNRIGPTPKLAAEVCSLTPENAQKEAEEAEREKDEAERKADEAEREKNEAEKKAEEAEKEAEEQQRRAEEAEREKQQNEEATAAAAEALAQELENQQAEFDSSFEAMIERNQMTLIIVGSAAAVIILVLVVLAQRRRAALKNSEQTVSAQNKEITDLRADVADWALVGKGSDGSPVAVKVIGKSLQLSADGVMVGRNPDAVQVVVADPTVSRIHARLSLAPEGGGLLIEDFGSSEGTFVGDYQLAVGDAVAVSEGSVIKLGGTVLTLRKES